MPVLLPRLRPELDLLPSSTADRPGLLLRDPFRFSDSALVVPPLLVRALTCFDGQTSEDELRALLAGLTGRREDAAAIADGLVDRLSNAGFLEDETYRRLRADCHARFRRETIRRAAFAGGGYPEREDELTGTLDAWLARATLDAPAAPETGSIPRLGIAAPHASPFAGVDTYRAAYRALGAPTADCTFVILGTSHYGALDRFGLTHKTFQTPLGSAVTDTALVEALARAAPSAIEVEDYCHAVEHSIEFQIVFLQRLYGPEVRILPILCGPFSGGTSMPSRPGRPPRMGAASLPEQVPAVSDALGALAALQAREGHRLRWVLGVDLAHVGPRYGDATAVRAGLGAMNDVADRDRERLARVTAGDAEGFWNLVHERGPDDLKWCGSSPLYAFLRAVPDARGRVLHYHQWQIDDTSVVSFAALEFGGPPAESAPPAAKT